MIDVGVRVHQVARFQIMRLEPADDFIDAVAAVDYDRLAGRFIAGDRAVTSERPYRKRIDNHPWQLARARVAVLG